MCVEIAGSEGLEEASPAGGISELEDEDNKLLTIISRDELTINGVTVSSRRCENVCIP
jgi:hypothetical protein